MAIGISPFSMIKSKPYYDPWKPQVSAPTKTGGGGMGATATKAFAEAEAYYGPDGGFGKGVEAGLERERTQAMSSGMQALVGSGLAGTTMAGGLGKKFAEEVGMPTRARIEETRAERLSSIKMLRAQLAQASTEAERQRISQELMARMSSDTSLALAGMRQGGDVQSPTMRMTAQPQTKTDSWSPGGLPSMTGAGATTYGVSGGMEEMPTIAPFGGAMYFGEEPPTGSVPYGRRTAPTVQEPQEPSGLSNFFWESIGK